MRLDFGRISTVFEKLECFKLSTVFKNSNVLNYRMSRLRLVICSPLPLQGQTHDFPDSDPAPRPNRTANAASGPGWPGDAAAARHDSQRRDTPAHPVSRPLATVTAGSPSSRLDAAGPLLVLLSLRLAGPALRDGPPPGAHCQGRLRVSLIRGIVVRGRHGLRGTGTATVTPSRGGLAVG